MTVRRLLGVALLAVLLGACGGGGDDDDDDGIPGGAKGALIRQADPICAETNARLRELGGDRNSREYVERAVPILTERVDRLRGLQAPREDLEQFQEFIAHSTNVRQSTEAAAFSFRANDPMDAAEDLRAAETARTKARQAAAEYGFVECAQD